MDHQRLTFLFGPDAPDLVEGYDLDEESDRMELVEAHLPLPPDAPHRGARMTVRTVAVNQILDDDPADTWRTVERLHTGGLDREEILSQLTMAIGEHLQLALASQSRFDVDEYVRALDALPLPTRTAIARAAIDTVRAEPGIDVDDHVEAIIGTLSVTRGRVVESLVDRVIEQLIDGPLHWLPGDATVHVPSLVDGRTFTHRLTDAEAELQVLTVSFDLAAFGRFDGVRLPDGTDLDQFSADRGHLAWRGPDGWLEAFEPDDLLAVTVTVTAPDGGAEELVGATVRIERLESEPEQTEELVRAVRDAYDREVDEPGLPVTGEDLALWLCFHQSELFTGPRPPLSVLCAAAGLEQRGGAVAHDESIWRAELFHRRFHRVMDLVPESNWRHVLGRALDALDDPEASVDEVRAALDECAEPETLDVLADVLFPHYLDLADEFELDRSDAPGRLFELVGRATAVARRPREVATASYLAAVLYERCGAPDRAEQHLVRAVDAQPRLGPVVERMGWYRFDRGDARGATKWWRLLGEPHPAAATIERFLDPSGGRKLGRNEPCWCGSGRKFKQCHQNATELPALPDRVAWLCRKAALWLEHSTGDVRDVVVQMATALATGDPDPAALEGYAGDLDLMFWEAFDDPIVFDAALHEGGLWSLFLHERGPLLPDDEQLLAASWRTVDRSVHEVVAVEPGVGMTLRDLVTGDVAEVRERTASRDAEVGERYCARVVPDGASNQIIGGVFPVRTGHESTVLDLCDENDGVMLCAWVGALHRPPELVHTPGMLDSMIDRDVIDAVMAGLGDDVDEETAMATLHAELARQTRTAWLDEHVPALSGLTPREAAGDPTRREQLERLLDEFDRMGEQLRAGSVDLPDGFRPVGYDTAELRRELGLD